MKSIKLLELFEGIVWIYIWRGNSTVEICIKHHTMRRLRVVKKFDASNLSAVIGGLLVFYMVDARSHNFSILHTLYFI